MAIISRLAARGFWRRRDGTAAAEFVLILPLIAIMLFGIMEIGRLLHDFHVVTKGVRNATRYLSRMPMTCAGGTGIFVDATDETEGKNMATTGTIAGGSLILGYFNNTHVTVEKTCTANGGIFAGVYNGWTDIPEITVQAAVPYTFLFGEYLIPGTASIMMTVRHNQVNIGD